jgi:hypothetical protein
MRGWKRALEALGHTVIGINYQQQSIATHLLNPRLEIPYDLLMTASNEGIMDLPIARLNEMGTAVIVNGLPFNDFRISPEPQAPNAHAKEVAHLAKLHKKLVWSQWMPEYVEIFYAGYRALGIATISLPYAADVDVFKAQPQVPAVLERDILFIGNLKHRQKINAALFEKLFALSRAERIQIFGDPLWQAVFPQYVHNLRPSNDNDRLDDYYLHSRLSPNFHTARQSQTGLQVNDRVFQIPADKGFQISDNPAIGEFYSADEVLWTQDTQEYVALAADFMKHPEKRLPFIERAYQKTMRCHTWLNRIASLWQALGISEPVKTGDKIWHPFEYEKLRADTRKVRFERHLYYWLESRTLGFARVFKKYINRKMA